MHKGFWLCLAWIIALVVGFPVSIWFAENLYLSRDSESQVLTWVVFLDFFFVPPVGYLAWKFLKQLRQTKKLEQERFASYRHRDVLRPT